MQALDFGDPCARMAMGQLGEMRGRSGEVNQMLPAAGATDELCYLATATKGRI